MQTAVVSYIGAGGTRPGVVVDLIGAVHVGDKSYYAELDKSSNLTMCCCTNSLRRKGPRFPKGAAKGAAVIRSGPCKTA